MVQNMVRFAAELSRFQAVCHVMMIPEYISKIVPAFVSRSLQYSSMRLIFVNFVLVLACFKFSAAGMMQAMWYKKD